MSESEKRPLLLKPIFPRASSHNKTSYYGADNSQQAQRQREEHDDDEDGDDIHTSSYTTTTTTNPPIFDSARDIENNIIQRVANGFRNNPRWAYLSIVGCVLFVILFLTLFTATFESYAPQYTIAETEAHHIILQREDHAGHLGVNAPYNREKQALTPNTKQELRNFLQRDESMDEMRVLYPNLIVIPDIQYPHTANIYNPVNSSAPLPSQGGADEEGLFPSREHKNNKDARHLVNNYLAAQTDGNSTDDLAAGQRTDNENNHSKEQQEQDRLLSENILQYNLQNNATHPAHDNTTAAGEKTLLVTPNNMITVRNAHTMDLPRMDESDDVLTKHVLPLEFKFGIGSFYYPVDYVAPSVNNRGPPVDLSLIKQSVLTQVEDLGVQTIHINLNYAILHEKKSAIKGFFDYYDYIIPRLHAQRRQAFVTFQYFNDDDHYELDSHQHKKKKDKQQNIDWLSDKSLDQFQDYAEEMYKFFYIKHNVTNFITFHNFQNFCNHAYQNDINDVLLCQHNILLAHVHTIARLKKVCAKNYEKLHKKSKSGDADAHCTAVVGYGLGIQSNYYVSRSTSMSDIDYRNEYTRGMLSKTGETHIPLENLEALNNKRFAMLNQLKNMRDKDIKKMEKLQQKAGGAQQQVHHLEPFNIYGGDIEHSGNTLGLSSVAQVHSNFLATGVFIHILNTGEYPHYYHDLLKASEISFFSPTQPDKKKKHNTLQLTQFTAKQTKLFLDNKVDFVSVKMNQPKYVYYDEQCLYRHYQNTHPPSSSPSANDNNNMASDKKSRKDAFKHLSNKLPVEHLNLYDITCLRESDTSFTGLFIGPRPNEYSPRLAPRALTMLLKYITDVAYYTSQVQRILKKQQEQKGHDNQKKFYAQQQQEKTFVKLTPRSDLNEMIPISIMHTVETQHSPTTHHPVIPQIESKYNYIGRNNYNSDDDDVVVKNNTTTTTSSINKNNTTQDQGIPLTQWLQSNEQTCLHDYYRINALKLAMTEIALGIDQFSLHTFQYVYDNYIDQHHINGLHRHHPNSTSSILHIGDNFSSYTMKLSAIFFKSYVHQQGRYAKSYLTLGEVTHMANNDHNAHPNDAHKLTKDDEKK